MSPDKLHIPTLKVTVVLLVVAFVGYHFLCGRKG